MKKVFSFLFVAILISTGALAQDDGGGTNGVSFGVKGGVNFASLTGDSADMDDLESRTGFQFGGVVNIPISELFAVQPEVFYSTQGFTLDETFEGITFEGVGKLNYINIPVLADFTVAEGFSLQGGPQIGFLVTDEFEVKDVDEDPEDLMAKSTDIGAAIGAQYRSPIGLFAQARYTIGLTQLLDEEDADFPDPDYKNAVFSICVGWFFN